MKIAILSPYPTFPFHKELGCRTVSYENNATWTIALADALTQLPETEVHVLTESTEIAATRTLDYRNLHLHFIKAPRQLKTLTLWHFDRLRLHGAVNDIRPDIVHGQGIENQYGDAAVSSPYPNLLTVHGIQRLSSAALNLRRFSRASIVEYTGSRCLAHAHDVVIINQFIEDHLRLDPQRYRLYRIPNPVAPHFFEDTAVAREPASLLAVGWLDRLKAHDILCRALALLRRRGVTARAKIIGPVGTDAYSQALRQYTRDENIDVEFTDFLHPGQVAESLRRCTVLVHPSRHDNAPLSICEAMACATPVIAARVGGISHLLRHGETGWLFEPGNAAELADQLELLLADTDLRRRLGENARRHAQETFHPRLVAEKTRAAYQTVLTQPCAAFAAN